MSRQVPLAIAEKTLDAVGARRKRGAFAVVMDVAGIVWLDYTHNVRPCDYVATVNYGSDPGWLADELEHEWRSRGG